MQKLNSLTKRLHLIATHYITCYIFGAVGLVDISCIALEGSQLSQLLQPPAVWGWCWRFSVLEVNGLPFLIGL